MGIDISLNEEQILIQDSAREFFQKNCPPDLVRQYENSDDEYPRDLWKQMAELGWQGMSYPEAYGGLGCSFLDVYPLYVEMGRCLAPTPFLDTVGLVGELICELGNEEQKRRILPGIANGDIIASSAIMEPDGLYGPAGIQMAAQQSGDGYSLNGTKVLVSSVGSASWLLCAARTSGQHGEDGVSLFLIDPKSDGVSAERVPNIAGYPLYAVTFKDVTVAPDNILGTVDEVWPSLDAAMMKAAVLQSAMVVGAGQRILDLSTDYARERVQFGQPIGKFQAVQYLCTDVAIHGHLTKLLTLQAAWRIDTGRPFLREAALAKASASRAAAAMTFAAHEVHAGIAFIKDYDLQLYTLRGKHWEWSLGDLRYHLERAVEESGV